MLMYHRLMARFYLKWNKKGYQKHVRKIVDRLKAGGVPVNLILS